MDGFTLNHTVRFHETDSAGVVYFANGLTICHSAYEASLATVGIDLGTFFGKGKLAYPIVKAKIDFRHPMRCGDRLKIGLRPQRRDQSTFEVLYSITADASAEKVLAEATTRHVCIISETRKRSPLPAEIEEWLQRWGN